MGILWIFVISILFLLGVLYFLAVKDGKHFTNQGVPYIGNNTYTMLFGNQTIAENVLVNYKQAMQQSGKMVGIKEFGQLSILLTDLELIKKILVKDFDHFVDRRQFNMSTHDYLLNKMLIVLKGDKWKSLRSKMSPTFTTGKIRRMFKIFDQSSKKLVTYFEKEMEKAGQIDMLEGYSKYTMDVIASAAFGIDSKAFNQSEPSIFEAMGRQLQFSFKGLAFFKIMFITLFPKLGDMMGLSFFSGDVQGFFSKAIKSTIQHREQSGEKRDDFIQLMLEAREGKSKLDESELSDFEKEAIIKTEDSGKLSLDDDDITAQCVLFILGGFDTTQSLLIFAAYALALEKDVQDRLLQEISASLEENDGEFTYDSINKMEYLDMVINETLRMYTPAVATDRACTKDYKIPDTDFILKKGDSVSIPVWGIHMDEKYYPDPKKFNPERFSPANRHKINPYAFLPFGLGPRNCIGMRFALTEVKLAIARLVYNFSLEPSEKTLIPMKFSNTGSLKPEGGMWLKLNRRN